MGSSSLSLAPTWQRKGRAYHHWPWYPWPMSCQGFFNAAQALWGLWIWLWTWALHLWRQRSWRKTKSATWRQSGNMNEGDQDVGKAMPRANSNGKPFEVSSMIQLLLQFWPSMSMDRIFCSHIFAMVQLVAHPLDHFGCSHLTFDSSRIDTVDPRASLGCREMLDFLQTFTFCVQWLIHDDMYIWLIIYVLYIYSDGHPVRTYFGKKKRTSYIWPGSYSES